MANAIFFVLRMSISRVCDLQKYFGLLALLVRHNYLYCTLTVCVYCLISRPCTLELTLTHTQKHTNNIWYGNNFNVSQIMRRFCANIFISMFGIDSSQKALFLCYCNIEIIIDIKFEYTVISGKHVSYIKLKICFSTDL